MSPVDTGQCSRIDPVSPIAERTVQRHAEGRTNGSSERPKDADGCNLDYSTLHCYGMDRAQIECNLRSNRSSEYVYFIQAGNHAESKIKIGRGIDPEDRLKTLQCGNTDKLHLLAIIPGDLAREKRLHARFAEGRIRGEWFRGDTPGLSEFISDALHFEGFWPEDRDSLPIVEVALS